MPKNKLWGKTKGMFWILMLLIGGITGIASAQESDTIEVAASAATQRLFSEAEGLLERGQSRRAYDLLSPHEIELSGNPLYDYLLGIAALDSGEVNEAIFALRRALSVEPGFSGARLELARAYYEAGNMALARPLFARLLEQNPPLRFGMCWISTSLPSTPDHRLRAPDSFPISNCLPAMTAMRTVRHPVNSFLASH